MCWEECAMISHWLYGTSWRLIKLIGIPVKGATACRLPLGDCHTRRVCILQVKDVHSLDWLLFSLFVNRLAHRQPGNQAVISYATHKGWMWIEKTKRETVYWRSPQCCFCLYGFTEDNVCTSLLLLPYRTVLSLWTNSGVSLFSLRGEWW